MPQGSFSPHCPFCDSPSAELVKADGLNNTVMVFRCSGCKREWSEVVVAAAEAASASDQRA
jgi:hypothetical protein